MNIAMFWSRVEKTDSCWLWQGKPTSSGYGRFSVGGIYKRAHRLSYELTFGPIPEGLNVCHRCDVPLCVNPNHLFLGTYADNNHDRDVKNRTSKGERHHWHLNPRRPHMAERNRNFKLYGPNNPAYKGGAVHA